MSTLIQPNPLPAQPQKPSPPGGATHERRSFGWLWTLLTLGVLGGLGYFGYSVWKQPAARVDAATYKTVTATSGPVEARIRVAGSSSARNYANVIAPMLRGPEARNPLVLMKITPGGSRVKKGDLIARIDGQWLVDHIDDVKDQMKQADNDVEKRKAEQAAEMENLMQTLRVAKSQWDKARLEFQAAEVRTDVERELLKLTLDETEARYKQQLADVKERSNVHASELKILGVTVQRHKIHHDNHVHDLTRYSIHATMDGLMVMSQYFRGGEMAQIGEGDQVNPGQAIAKVVDPSSMQIEGNANQSESDQIHVGQEVQVGFDSFPGMKLRGKVSGLGALAKSGGREGYFVRQVGVRVQILDQDPRLIPDLSAYGDVLIQRAEAGNAVHVPTAALVDEAGKSYLYVKNGAAFEKRPVVRGLQSNLDTAILQGLKAGEEVRLN